MPATLNNPLDIMHFYAEQKADEERAQLAAGVNAYTAAAHAENPNFEAERAEYEKTKGTQPPPTPNPDYVDPYAGSDDEALDVMKQYAGQAAENHVKAKAFADKIPLHGRNIMPRDVKQIPEHLHELVSGYYIDRLNAPENADQRSYRERLQEQIMDPVANVLNPQNFAELPPTHLKLYRNLIGAANQQNPENPYAAYDPRGIGIEVWKMAPKIGIPYMFGVEAGAEAHQATLAAGGSQVNAATTAAVAFAATQLLFSSVVGDLFGPISKSPGFKNLVIGYGKGIASGAVKMGTAATAQEIIEGLGAYAAGNAPPDVVEAIKHGATAAVKAGPLLAVLHTPHLAGAVVEAAKDNDGKLSRGAYRRLFGIDRSSEAERMEVLKASQQSAATNALNEFYRSEEEKAQQPAATPPQPQGVPERALENQATGPGDGSRSPQPEDSEKPGNPPESSPGVQQGGSGEEVPTHAPQPEVDYPPPPDEEEPPAAQVSGVIPRGMVESFWEGATDEARREWLRSPDGKIPKAWSDLTDEQQSLVREAITNGPPDKDAAQLALPGPPERLRLAAPKPPRKPITPAEAKAIRDAKTAEEDYGRAEQQRNVAMNKERQRRARDMLPTQEMIDQAKADIAREAEESRKAAEEAAAVRQREAAATKAEKQSARPPIKPSKKKAADFDQAKMFQVEEQADLFSKVAKPKKDNLPVGSVGEVDGSGQIGIIAAVNGDKVTLVFDGGDREEYDRSRISVNPEFQDSYSEEDKKAAILPSHAEQAAAAKKAAGEALRDVGRGGGSTPSSLIGLTPKQIEALRRVVVEAAKWVYHSAADAIEGTRRRWGEKWKDAYGPAIEQLWKEHYPETPAEPPKEPPAAPPASDEWIDPLTGKPPIYGSVIPIPPGAAKDASAAAEGLTKIWRSLREVFSPTGVSSESKGMAGIVRERAAELAKRHEQAKFALRKFSRTLMKMPLAECYKFIDGVESGTPQATPELDDAAAEMRNLLDAARDRIQALGKGQLENFIENYFPHIWKDPKKAAEVFGVGKRPLEGSKAFLKKRTIPTTKEGLAAGLEPVTDNPVDLVLLKLHEVNRYEMAQKILQEGKDTGYIRLARTPTQKPDGWVKIDDKIGTVWERRPTEKKDGSEGAPEFIHRGDYYAHPDAGRILNNYLSPGLRGNAVYDAVRFAGNAMNMSQLGLSFFHVTGTAINSIVSRTGLAAKMLMEGGLAESVKMGIKAWIAPIETLITGNKVIHEALEPGTQGQDFAQIVDALQAGGHRLRQDDMYRLGREATTHWDLFLKRLKEHRPSAVPQAFLAALEQASRPMMEWYIPRMKQGVMLDMARYELSKLPADATRTELRERMREVVDSVDNRLGQLIYDNLFWNKTLKDALMVSTRSLGWNLGTVRELAGGARDIAKMGRDVLQGKRPELTHAASYAIALPFVVGILGAGMNYLYTGHGPQSLMDMYHIPTGQKSPDGQDEEIQLPTYMRDVFSWFTHPGKTLIGKTHPLVASIVQMLNNQDFYYHKIVNPDDPLVDQAEELGKYVAEQFVPFSIRNIGERKVGSGKKAIHRPTTLEEKFESFMGITPVPQEKLPAKK